MDYLKAILKCVLRYRQMTADGVYKRHFFLLIFLMASISSVEAANKKKTVSVLASTVVGFLGKKVQPDGVCLYTEADFSGDRICFTDSQAVLDAQWDNQVSSVGISATYYAIFHDAADFGGTSSPVHQGDQANLVSFDNIISSITIAQLDADNDGISDYIDLCPDTPQGELALPNGCSLTQLDSDEDGVSDAYDLCGDTVSGSGIAVDLHGCTPTQDADGDGVPNNQDSYPLQNNLLCTP